MKTLMVTWTDIFEGTGSVFQWIFKGMKALGHGPNVLIGGFIIFLLVWWCLRIARYKKEAARNGTLE